MISVVILFVLIAQSSASFYNEFTYALGSIESKVGKLITDVKTDLRDTYDCTIDAVEEVIYDKDQIPKYYDKCKETSTKSSPVVVKDAPQIISIYIKPIESGSPKDGVATISGDAVTDRDSKDIDKKLASVEQVVNNEYYRVDNMSSHLEHEFDGLSKSVDQKLRMIAKEKEDLQKILLEIKNLHLEEELQIEKTKDEIRKAFDEILKKINNSTRESDLRNEMNAAMGDINKNSSKTILGEIEKWKEKGMAQLKNLQKENSTSQSSTETNIPRTFKEVAAKISKTSTTNKESNSSNPDVSSTETVTSIPLTVTTSPIKLESQVLSSSTVRSLVTQAQSALNIISSTESVSRSSTLSSIDSITQSSTVATKTPSTSTTLPSPVPVIKTSTVNITSFTEPVTRASITTTTTSTKPVTRASTTTTSTEPATPASKRTTTTFKEPVTRASVTTINTSTEPVTQASTTTTTTSTEPMTRASTLTTTTSVKPIIRVSTAITTTEQVTLASSVPSFPMNTKKLHARVTTTAKISTEAITQNTFTMKKKPKKHRKKTNNFKFIRYTTPKQLIKLASSTPRPSNNVDSITPKNTLTPVAEALKIFSKSMKTKPVLDKFFKNLDSVPKSFVF